MATVSIKPASRFLNDQGQTIYTKVERKGLDLTWRTALGAIVWVGRNCFYAPLFFWRGLR